MNKIFDLHSHFNHGSKYDCPESPIHKRNLPFLLNDYKKVGIIGGAFSTYSSVLTDKDIYESNEYLYNFAERNDNIFQWLVLDPRQPILFEQIQKLITGRKVLGIKIHSIYHGYDICEYGDKIFSFADKLNCFVLMHPDKISDTVYFADKYKNMNLIIAHLGSEEHVEAIKSSKHGNIFTDTSGGNVTDNNVIEYAVEQVGADKIFFGTDSYSCGYEVGRIQYSDISQADKNKIFYDNASRYFNIDKKL